LEPDKKSLKAYGLLREALKRTGKVGIATVVLRHKELLVMLKADGEVIVLNQLRFSAEIKSSADLVLPRNQKISAKELQIAEELIEKSTAPFKPAAHKDRYLKELETIIREKSRGRKPKKRGQKLAPTHVDDLVAQLQKSLRTSRTHK
jgi:DNA end-binding protein Ku